MRDVCWCNSRADRVLRSGNSKEEDDWLAERLAGPTDPQKTSVAQLQLLGNGLIPVDIGVVQVIEEATALTDHHEQPSPRAVILFCGL